MAKILIADDEKSIRIVLRKFLNSLGHEVLEAEDGEEALRLLREEEPDLAFIDIRMPKLSGLLILDKVKNVPIVMLTAYGTMDYTVQAIEKGAIEYITKPFSLEEIEEVVERILSSKEKEKEEDLEGQTEIVGTSKKMQEVFKFIGRVAKTDATVLILGESGTGKELVARAIHKYSNRKNKPFITVNCAALPSNLLEAELFGHEKGAFTGAYSTKKGLFEEANGGTIFLDEIGELELSLQSKLLRVLQEKEIRRVGGNRTIKIDVRIIAATNKNLEEEVKKGNFREDLFYRLNVVTINLPPLRERKEDIILLAQFFIKKFSQEFKLPLKELSQRAREWLLSYPFPGNVRELENMILRAMLLSPVDVIDINDLKSISRDSLSCSVEDAIKGWIKSLKGKENIYDFVIRKVEKILISEVLKECNFNQVKASKILGIHRNTLRKKIRELEIKLKNRN